MMNLEAFKLPDYLARMASAVPIASLFIVNHSSAPSNVLPVCSDDVTSFGVNLLEERTRIINLAQQEKRSREERHYEKYIEKFESKAENGYETQKGSIQVWKTVKVIATLLTVAGLICKILPTSPNDCTYTFCTKLAEYNSTINLICMAVGVIFAGTAFHSTYEESMIDQLYQKKLMEIQPFSKIADENTFKNCDKELQKVREKAREVIEDEFKSKETLPTTKPELYKFEIQLTREAMENIVAAFFKKVALEAKERVKKSMNKTV